MKKEEMFEACAEALAEVAQEVCMKSLKEKDRDLNLTGKCKKCYNYLAEQFILNYINGKSMLDIMDDTMSDKFYNTWLAFLEMVKRVVKEGRKFHGVEDIINHSGISRKNLMKFLDYYFQAR